MNNMLDGYYGRTDPGTRIHIHRGSSEQEAPMEQLCGCILGALDAIHKLGNLHHGNMAKIDAPNGYSRRAAEIRSAQRGWFHRLSGYPLHEHRIINLTMLVVTLGWSLVAQQAIKYYECRNLRTRAAASRRTLRQFLFHFDGDFSLLEQAKSYKNLYRLLGQADDGLDYARHTIAKNLLLTSGLVVGSTLCIIGFASGAVSCTVVGLASAAIIAAVRGIVDLIELFKGEELPEFWRGGLNNKLQNMNRTCNVFVQTLCTPENPMPYGNT